MNEDILIPRRTEDRLERMIRQYIKNGNKGDLDLSDLNLTKFPDVLKYVKSVDGDFYCNNNQLTSLEGAPKSVDGDFWCNRNQLKSLEGAPVSVGGNFWCKYSVNNPVKFTEEQVRAICDVKGDISV